VLKQRDIANYKGLYGLSYVDKSFMEDQEEPSAKESAGVFIRKNFTNQKLGMIGASFLKMMIKG
jgi:hypothetical protein